MVYHIIVWYITLYIPNRGVSRILDLGQRDEHADDLHLARHLRKLQGLHPLFNSTVLSGYSLQRGAVGGGCSGWG